MNDVQTYPPPAPGPVAVNQSTAIEQSRAVAEVQAAVLVAQNVPRDMQAALSEMRQSCRQKALADRAFWRFPRGREQLSGPSVQLARELARCFGNVQYGTVELSRDLELGQSEYQSFAWDVQMNTRASTTFIVPHRRDTKQGIVALTELRDIYENNANQAARRLREQIFAILPPWFVEEAKALCMRTLEDGGGKSLAQQVADLIAAFEEYSVTVEQLEHKLGRKRAQWVAPDLASLRVIGSSLRRGETSVDAEFPDEPVTAEQITGGAS